MSNKKIGIDYFPVLTNTNEKITNLITDLGFEGKGIFITLLEKIYGKRGYYIYYRNERELKGLAREIGCEFEKLKALIEWCLIEDVFDKEQFDKHKILTNDTIMNDFYKVDKKRSSINQEARWKYLKEEIIVGGIVTDHDPT